MGTRMWAVATLALAVSCMATAAEARSVAEFLGIAEPLRSKGIMGTYSEEFRQLNAEADSALAKWLKSSAAAKPKVCPAQNATDMSVDGFLNLLRSIRPSQRTKISVDAAVKRLMDAKFRCG